MTSPKAWDSNLYQKSHDYVWEYGRELISLLDPKPEDEILDVGCGTGQLTAQLSKHTKQIIGSDSSESMILSAQENYPTSEYPNLSFEIQPAEKMLFDQKFDKVFSNAALHWVTDADNAIRCMRKTLRDGGKFVMEMGGHGNVQQIVSSIKSLKNEMNYKAYDQQMFFFPTIGDYASRLERNGFEAEQAFLFDRMTELSEKDGLRNWIVQFQTEELASIPADERDHFLSKIEEACREKLYFDGKWHADYRRLRVVARAV